MKIRWRLFLLAILLIAITSGAYYLYQSPRHTSPIQNQPIEQQLTELREQTGAPLKAEVTELDELVQLYLDNPAPQREQIIIDESVSLSQNIKELQNNSLTFYESSQIAKRLHTLLSDMQKNFKDFNQVHKQAMRLTINADSKLQLIMTYNNETNDEIIAPTIQAAEDANDKQSAAKWRDYQQAWRKHLQQPLLKTQQKLRKWKQSPTEQNLTELMKAFENLEQGIIRWKPTTRLDQDLSATNFRMDQHIQSYSTAQYELQVQSKELMRHKHDIHENMRDIKDTRIALHHSLLNTDTVQFNQQVVVEQGNQNRSAIVLVGIVLSIALLALLSGILIASVFTTRLMARSRTTIKYASKNKDRPMDPVHTKAARRFIEARTIHNKTDDPNLNRSSVIEDPALDPQHLERMVSSIQQVAEAIQSIQQRPQENDVTREILLNDTSIATRGLGEVANRASAITNDACITIQSLNDTPADLQRLIDTLKTITLQVNHLAVDVSVEAAALGPEHTALTETATQMKNLSELTLQSVTEMSACCNAIRERSENATTAMQQIQNAMQAVSLTARSVTEALERAGNHEGAEQVNDASQELFAMLERIRVKDTAHNTTSN